MAPGPMACHHPAIAECDLFFCFVLVFDGLFCFEYATLKVLDRLCLLILLMCFTGDLICKCCWNIDSCKDTSFQVFD